MGWHIVTGHVAGEWIAKTLGCAYFPERSEAIGLQNPNGFVAGVIYEDWNGKSLVTHIAVTGCMTSAFLAAIFDYPFNVCGAHKIIAPVSSDNARCIGLVKNMGFAEEARLKDASPTGDILLFTLCKNDCRFLKERYGKKSTRAPARA